MRVESFHVVAYGDGKGYTVAECLQIDVVAIDRSVESALERAGRKVVSALKSQARNHRLFYRPAQRCLWKLIAPGDEPVHIGRHAIDREFLVELRYFDRSVALLSSQ